MSALARTPLRKKRPGKPRRVLQECSVGRCKRRADQAMCKTHAQQKADSLFAAHIRARGRCEVASWFPKVECRGALQCSHIVSRRYHAIRWSEGNAVSSCAAHHLYTTNHPMEWEVAVNERHYIPFDTFRLHALRDSIPDPLDVIESLAPSEGEPDD